MKADSMKVPFLASILLISILLMVLPEQGEGQEEGMIRIYPHLAGTLDTIPPTSSEIRPEAFSLSSQETKTYTLTYPLTKDVTIKGGDNDTLILHLAASQTITIDDDFELDVRFVAVTTTGSEIQIAGGLFRGTDMGADLLELSVTDPSGLLVSEGSSLELRISLIGDITLPSQTFTYNIYTPSDTSYLEIGMEPLESDDIGIELTDTGGSPLEEVLSNGPASTRTFNISVSVRDAFGAYDVSEVNIILTSGEGNIIWNHTSEPSGGEGDPLAYLNRTHTIAEGTPEGDYLITVTATSMTGGTGTAEGSLTVASGLYVTVDDPDRGADAGETVEFQMSILNGGEGTDRVDFEMRSDRNWNGEAPDPVEIEGGATLDVTFRIFVPIRAAVGETDSISLTANSRNSERSYSRTAAIIVENAASFGVAAVGDTTTAVISGGGASFTIEIVNIMNRTESFEIGTEDLPAGWSASYSGGNGSNQGSLYVIDVPGEGDVTVDISIMTSQDSEGVNDLRVFVRERGETERKYVYLKVRVVDPDRSALRLVDTTNTKTSGRVGTSTPVRYSEVFFNLEIYNPALSEATARINVFKPTDWTVEYDYQSIDLLPGEVSYWNISITPVEGELYSEDPFTTTVEVSGISSGTASQALLVAIPKITSVEVAPDKNSPDVIEGGSVQINLTFTNIGNHPFDISIASEQPENVEVTLDPTAFLLDPGSERKVNVIVRVLSIEDEGEIDITVDYDFDDRSGSKEISVYAIRDETQSGGIETLWIIIGIVAAIILVLAAYFGYSRFFVKRKDRSDDPPRSPEKGSTRKAVDNTAKGQPETSGRPVKSGEMSENIKKADHLADEILSSSDDRKELSGGITIEAEPEVVTAEIVE